MTAYADNHAAAHALALEASVVGAAIQRFAQSQPDGWQGKVSELLEILNKQEGYSEQGKHPKGWPGAPHVLGNRLRCLAPNLRALGVDLSFDREKDRSRTRLITVRSIRAVQPVFPSLDLRTASDGMDSDPQLHSGAAP